MNSNDLLFKSIESDIIALDKVTQANLDSKIKLVSQVANYIINSGGKRLRPKLLILVSKALGYQGSDHITLATIIEYIHVATLLHDDVVDESNLRRGKVTANHKFGNAASVLVGDFLFSRAFQMMVSIDNKSVFSVLANTTNIISEGEVLQLMHCGDSSITVEDYYSIIEKKTANLFESAAWLSGLISNSSEGNIEIVKEYGKQLGMAFQVIDDLLDYTANQDEMGKSIGDDLKEGKVTLPLIIALEQANTSDKKHIQEIIKTQELDNFSKILAILESTGAIKQTQAIAKSMIDKAINATKQMPDNQYTNSLFELAKKSLYRIN